MIKKHIRLHFFDKNYQVLRGTILYRATIQFKWRHGDVIVKVKIKKGVKFVDFGSFKIQKVLKIRKVLEFVSDFGIFHPSIFEFPNSRAFIMERPLIVESNSERTSRGGPPILRLTSSLYHTSPILGREGLTRIHQLSWSRFIRWLESSKCWIFIKMLIFEKKSG